MTISYQQWGNIDAKEQILLIHGWAMNSSVWTDIADTLTQHYPQKLIRAVDLPGYGYSADSSPAEYSTIALAKIIEPLLQGKQTTIIAWSMGGLIAIELSAKQNSTIEKLILVSSSPCFVQTDDWKTAVEAKVFETFGQSLSQNHQLTIKRFLAIQAMGSRTAREDIKTLQKQLLLRGEPDIKALESGLQLLLNEDKRAQLKTIDSIPIILISGNRDTLIPIQGLEQLAKQENTSLFIISGAGHSPFISHPEEFKQILKKVIYF